MSEHIEFPGNKIEADPSLEHELFPAECIVIPGHSIEFVKRASGTGTWKPTRLIQGVNERGWRTGKRKLDLTPKSEDAIVGGGTAVTLAAAEYFSELKENGTPLKLIIFAAGRPAYLNENAPEDPELVEGKPMVKLFEQETRAIEELGEENVVVLWKGHKNTQDDVEKSIELAVSRGYTRIAFLLLELRLERAEAFWNAIRKEKPELNSLDVRFLAAEDFLRRRYKEHPEMARKIISAFESSRAFDKTKKSEVGGAKAVREGGYQGKGNY